MQALLERPASGTGVYARSYVAPRAGRAERIALVSLAALYLFCAVGFALVTPYGEAPDEPHHTLFVEYLVRFRQLPPIEKNAFTPDSFHPPLYYTLGAGMVAAGRLLVGNFDMQEPVAPYPIGNPAFMRGDYNAMIHPPETRWPLWPYVIRAISILMGLGVVLLTYATARTLVPPPSPAVVPLIATAFAALLPQANFIRASVSNENLADLLGAWIILLLVSHLMGPYNSRRVVWIGVAYGLALLTKLSLAPFVLPIVWALWLRRNERTGALLKDLAAFALPALALAGWYYLYRWVAYGDPLAIAAWHRMLPSDSRYTLADLFWFQEPFRMMLWTSFWGNFGWQQIWLPYWIYNSAVVVTLLAVGGGVYLVIRRALTAAQMAACSVLVMAVLLMYALVIQASTYLIAWQGREMYPALSSVCVLFGLGFGAVALGRGAVQPAAISLWRYRLGSAVTAVVALGLLAANIYSILWVVFPALN
jgi:hypothetical protein